MKVLLYVVHGRPQGKSFLFPPGEYYFGRGAECHIQPNSDWVSRQHCVLRVGHDAVCIRDLGSRNGTLVNGKRVVGDCPLTHEDQIQVGPLVFEVRLEETAVVAPPSPQASSSAMAPTDPNINCADTAEQPTAPKATPSPEPPKETALADEPPKKAAETDVYAVLPPSA
jgi:predicted component of type VI protein secretion system